MTTRAGKVADGYRLTGAKMWISNAPIADVFVCGQIDGTRQRHPRLHLEKGMKGLTAPKIGGKLSCAAPSPAGRHGRREVRPAPNVSGLKGPFGCPQRATVSPGARWAPPGLLAPGMAAPSTANSSAVRWRNPVMQKKLADMQTEIAGPAGGAPRRPTDGRGQRRRRVISIVKRNNCGRRSTLPALRDMHGGNGVRSNTVMRHAANLETVNTYEGTRDVHALILSRAQTGLQAFSTVQR
jgi:glutaryl-CoA dehydrogenase